MSFPIDSIAWTQNSVANPLPIQLFSTSGGPLDITNATGYTVLLAPFNDQGNNRTLLASVTVSNASLGLIAINFVTSDVGTSGYYILTVNVIFSTHIWSNRPILFVINPTV